jgi:DHA1 family bicyclomycin/chloramphenicol resistance-like MFS transporter
MNKAPPRLVVLLASLSALGPFSIDTYLPAFPAMAENLGTSDIAIQQTLTAYLLPFAFMMLWHGALSDALGRRRIILGGLALFAASSLLCAFAGSIETLLLGRALQGLTAGAGMVIGRAIVRDLFDGAEAQRLMAKIAVLFAIAPAIAPVIGGWVLYFFNWHGIFLFLALFTGLLLIACWRWLPETLPPEKRQSLHPVTLARAYGQVFSHHEFRRLALANAFNFNGLFIYVLAAPVFLIRHLGLSPQAFASMFMPVVAGMMFGSLASGHLAGRLSPARTVATGYLMMIVAAIANLAMNLAMPATLPWAIIPLSLFACGMALAMPSLQLLALDFFPERRGLASSCMGVIHTGINALAAALLIPLLWDSTVSLAGGMLGMLLLGAAAFAISRWLRQPVA